MVKWGLPVCCLFRQWGRTRADRSREQRNSRVVTLRFSCHACRTGIERRRERGAQTSRYERMTTVPKADEEAVVSTLPQDPSFESDYNRFSKKRKWVIVGIVSYMMFLGPFSGTAVLPAIPNIATDLNTSDTAVTYTNAIFFCTMAVSPCIFAPLSQVFQIVAHLIPALRPSANIYNNRHPCLLSKRGNRAELQFRFLPGMSVSDRPRVSIIHCHGWRECCRHLHACKESVA